MAGTAGDKTRPVTLVLLTDGGEDTRPRQDPVAAAEEVGKLQGLNFQIVGFDINRDDWDQQLRQMAAGGRGTYIPASEAASLARDLLGGVPRARHFRRDHRQGPAGLPRTVRHDPCLPEGKYRFETTFAGSFGQDFWVNTDATTAVVFDAANMAKDTSGQAVAEGKGGAATTPPPAGCRGG